MTSNAQLFAVLAELKFDVKSGIELSGNDEDFYCELISDLRSDVLSRRAAALLSDNPATRREYAHMLKGTLQVLGETIASAKARVLEQRLRNGEPEGDAAAELLKDLDRIDAALQRVFGAA